MALTSCSECKGRVSDLAPMCPHCGFATTKVLDGRQPGQKTNNARTGASQAQEALHGHEEKRRHRRIEFKTMVTVNQETAMLYNISHSGMKLSSPFTPRAASVDITLDNGERIFAMKGTIRWVSAKRSFSNLVDFGVEITTAPPGYHEFVEILLACQ